MKKLLLLTITILSLFVISCANQAAYDTQIKDSDTSPDLTSESDTVKEAEIQEAPASKEYNEKVSEELKEQLEAISDGEYISVSVYLVSPKHSQYDVSEDYINRLVRNREAVFERNLRLFNEENKSQLTFKELTGKQFKELSQIDDDIYTDEEIDGMIISSNTVEEIYSMYERTKSLHLYRQKVKEANQARNDELCQMLDMEKCKNIYKNPLLSIVNMSCTKSYIFELQEISIISQISYNDPNEYFAPDTIG
ncbi:MAG: hypothetical protein II984_01700 [Clostridia bacterium]|nr:hypothetical protein [Clostridia bacterium]